jgi:hypothetical protein
MQNIGKIDILLFLSLLELLIISEGRLSLLYFLSPKAPLCWDRFIVTASYNQMSSHSQLIVLKTISIFGYYHLLHNRA